MTLELSKKYKFLEKIGEGSFSEVLKVQERTTGNLYAAKRLKKVYKSKEDVFNCPEVNAIRRLEHHPNIVSTIDVVWGKLPGHIVLLFELMDMSLFEYIKTCKRCLSETKVKNFMYQLICALQHLHLNGIFHRDIKPENILMKLLKGNRLDSKRTEIIQLADLGSACRIHSNPPHTAYISTRWYRAPECLLSCGYYGPKMDIWSLGCVFYEMLTLLPLFPGTNELDQLFLIHNILGSPSPRTLARFKHRNINCAFPKRPPIGFYNLLPFLSEKGLDVLNKMLVYLPDLRMDITRLLHHSYFDDLRHLRRSFVEYSTTSLLRGEPANIKTESNANLIKVLKKDSVIRNKDYQPTNPGCRYKSCTSKSLDNVISHTCYSSDTNSVIKLKERAWGMNPGNAKTAIIKTISSYKNIL